MKKANFQELLTEIVERDPRYPEDAYVFLRQALDFTVKRLEKPIDGPGRHVSGQELLQGIRTFTLEQFGPMAYRVLTTWGIRSTEDFGALVFNLVNAGLLGKTKEDRIEDFSNGYDFETAFNKPFRPQARTTRSRRAAKLN